MGTLTSVLDIARQALLADQLALNATANNVANQNTPGYTREAVSFQSEDSVSLGGTSQSTGVTATESSQRDRILEQRVQQQTQVVAQSGALGAALQQVENIFGLSSTSSGAAAVSSSELGGAINTFFSSLSSLEGDPSDTSTRQSVLSAATALAGAFNDASNQLTQISSSLNQEVSSDVSQVNALTSSIATLNGQIASVSPNGDAGTLEDQRQEDIDQLSQLVGLDQISTSQNGISLTTSNGATLVSGSQSFQMSTTQVGGNTHVLAGDPPQDVTSSLTGGDMGGALQARDQNLPAYSNALDSLAFAIGNAVNTQNEQGIDSSGNPGLAIFSVSSTATGAAASIAVSATGAGAIAAASPGEGSSGNDNATALANLSSANIVGSQTATDFLSSLLSQIGSDTSGVTTENTAQQAALTQLTTQRDSLSGVSLDTEAANLTQYQRSYQAASQVFTIVDALMANAINLGVQTAVT
jgi:flagellar hook-associated protein 1 FlgK